METKHEGQAFEIDNANTKWRAQEIGVNSNIPLVDEGRWAKYVIRQFKFYFDPLKLQQIKEKKIPPPTNQDLFNSVWQQIKIELWKDGLIAIQEKELPPQIVTKRKSFVVILTCQPRLGVMVAERPKTLQEITKPSA